MAKQQREMTGPLANIGLGLKVLRTRANLTQENLAERASVTKAQVSNYETGREQPKLSTLDRVLTALGVTSLHGLAEVLEEVGRSAEWLGGSSGRHDAGAEEEEQIAARRAAALRSLRHSFDLYLRAVEEAARKGDD